MMRTYFIVNRKFSFEAEAAGLEFQWSMGSRTYWTGTDEQIGTFNRTATPHVKPVTEKVLIDASGTAGAWLTGEKSPDIFSLTFQLRTINRRVPDSERFWLTRVGNVNVIYSGNCLLAVGQEFDIKKILYVAMVASDLTAHRTE